MSQLSPKVKEKLERAKEGRPEIISNLQSVPIHLYIENISLEHVKLALHILKKGTKRIESSRLLYDLRSIEILADYLLEPLLKKRIKRIKSTVTSTIQNQPQPKQRV